MDPKHSKALLPLLFVGVLMGALDLAIGVALLWAIVAEEEDRLGPVTASDLRHGRVPLSDLTVAPSVEKRPRLRRRGASTNSAS